jgi:hypothetical protein
MLTAFKSGKLLIRSDVIGYMLLASSHTPSAAPALETEPIRQWNPSRSRRRMSAELGIFFVASVANAARKDALLGSLRSRTTPNENLPIYVQNQRKSIVYSRFADRGIQKVSFGTQTP